ncbi:hypothetical protein G5V59_18710 [Nocardioides sp. W3-2-3]|uniref:hypothetical protein n=1 Tax=Nocardioides convexus TaxID=2712224 RepID=UPI002418B3EE|nr:hypothetical protein [Nocardioides convexus]NHA01195.1 hypothetical protein [Nocardioides convexus]
MAINPDQVCNLCDRQMSITLGATVEEANAGGQQALLRQHALAAHQDPLGQRPPGRQAQPAQPPPAPGRQVRHHRVLPGRTHPTRTLRHAPRPHHLDDPRPAARAAHQRTSCRPHRTSRWRPSSTPRSSTMPAATAGPSPPSTEPNARCASCKLMQDTPGTTLLASDAIRLQEIGLTALPVIDVATAAGVMLDDRQPAIHAYVEATIADLPDPMRAEVREWFEVMINGSTTPPRRKPRDQQTIRLYLRWAMPALTTWAEQGHHSLREITSSDVRAVLPASGNPRSTMGAGLRSILTLLKARKVLFVNPIARIQTGSHERRDPLPAHAEKIRTSLLSPDPACAALTALATFHGLRAGEPAQHAG